MMIYLAMASLALVSILCALGTLHRWYDDNLLQRLGMACISVSCISLMQHVWQYRYVTNACGLLSAGLAVFALGVLLKVVKFNLNKPRLRACEVTQ